MYVHNKIYFVETCLGKISIFKKTIYEKDLSVDFCGFCPGFVR